MQKWFCHILIIAILAIILMPPTLAADTISPTSATLLTPSSHWYGIKTTFEGIIQKLSSIIPSIGQKYLSHLDTERTNEFVAVVKNNPTDITSALQALNSSSAYEDIIHLSAQNNEAYWVVQKNMMDNLYIKMMGFDLWMKIMLPDHAAQANYSEAIIDSTQLKSDTQSFFSFTS